VYVIQDGEDLAFRFLSDLDPSLFDVKPPSIKFQRRDWSPYVDQVEIHMAGPEMLSLYSDGAGPSGRAVSLLTGSALL